LSLKKYRIKLNINIPIDVSKDDDYMELIIKTDTVLSDYHSSRSDCDTYVDTILPKQIGSNFKKMLIDEVCNRMTFLDDYEIRKIKPEIKLIGIEEPEDQEVTQEENLYYDNNEQENHHQ
jgi:hypothetical protein